MNREHSIRVEQVFLAALEKQAEERTAFVREACSDEPEVLQDVLSLLGAETDASRFFAALAEDVGAPYQGTPDDADVDGAGAAEADPGLVGRQIGAFHLVRVLGRGGIGTVYLGERTDGGFEQQVAVKLLRRGLDTDDILSRFRMERQILASLNHPHIAHLLGGGAAEDGRPYLVMEFVEGRPITEYCDRHRLSIAQRLRLFVKVARAVQHAHRNLILHRDIKPSNILVTENGTPKLLDFGIAKLLDPAGAPGGNHLTRTGMRLMTPEYASPEQLRGEPATTASDAYQLGILLYRLLSGRRPYPSRARARARARTPEGLGDVAHGSGGLVTLPSRAFLDPHGAAGGQGGAPPEEIARLRRTEVRRLRATLAGDLDTIVQKALRREPDRRYDSAGELADDIDRYLTGRPVAARQDTLAYRSRRFVARHPAGVAMTALALLGLGGYVVTLQSHTVKLEQERDRAEEALQRTELETSRAQEVTAFISGLFEDADPARARGAELTVREVLDRTNERSAELPEDPEVRAELLSVMARVYVSLGLPEPALPLAEEALALHRQAYEEPHLNLARGHHLLGAALQAAGEYRAAEEAYHAALAAVGELAEPDYHLMAATLQQLAALHLTVLEAVPLQEALQGALAVLDDAGSDELDNPERLWVLGGLHSIALDGTAYLDVTEREVEARRRRDGDDHPDLVQALYRLGRARNGNGDVEGFVSAVREGLELSRRVLGEEHPSTVEGLMRWSTVLSLRGDDEASERVLREAISITRRTLGHDHLSLAEPLVQLSARQRRREAFDEAEQSLAKALEIYEGSRAFARASDVLAMMATLARHQGDLDRAESISRRAMSLPVEPYGPPIREVGLGDLLREKGDFEAAEQIYRSGLAYEQRWGSLNKRAELLGKLGVMLMDQGDLDGAEPFVRESDELTQRLFSNEHARSVNSAARLVRLDSLRRVHEPPGR